MIFKYVAGVTGALALLAAAGWYLTDGSLDRAKADRDTYKTAYTDLQNTLARERAQAESARQIEQAYQEELTNARAEIADLRSAVAAGDAVVRVHANCAPVPKAATAKPGNDAGAAKLTSDAESAYFDLVEQHQRILAQVKALQDFAVLCSSGTQPQP